MWGQKLSSARRAVARVSVLALVGAGGLGWAGVSLAGPSSSGVPVLSLHPNHMVSRPGAGNAMTRSAVGWASSNWSGYAVSAASSSFTSVGAHWRVPAVSRTLHATYSAAWAGIDGFTNSSLIQTGTEQDYYRGAAHYGAWWTTSAQGFVEQFINEPVSAGDPMVATISGVGTSWTIVLADLSTVHPWRFVEGPITYTGPGASAEWVLEAPTVGGRVATLAHYSSPLTFDPGTANGVAPNLQASNGGELVQGGRVVSLPSSPDSDKDGFNISYGSTAPSPPKS